MKKLLFILLCLPLLFTTCKKEEEAPNNNGNNQDDIVGKKWSGYVPNFGDRIFELNNDGYLYFYTVNCIAYFQNDTLGEWLIIGDTIKYTYTNNNIEYKQIFGVMDGYSNTEIKFVLTSDSNSTCVIHTFTTSNCTYVPDDAFEQHLIDEGYDNVLDDYVTTASIDTVTYLYISEKHIYDLTGIEDFTALTYLDCYNNQLTTLDLSNNPALDTLACTSNQLTTLDVSNNTALTVLRCGGNQLTSLDLGNNTALTLLWCLYNQLTTLDVSQNTALTTLYCYNNQLTTLDVSNNTDLTVLWCPNNQLTSLDLSNNTALNNLECHYNQLTTLDVRNGNNTKLFPFFFCGNNPLLYCIDVDDAAWSTANWTNIDPQSFFSEDCGVE
jgi:Leucine-rich repeat (LRR) protein